MNAEYDYGIKIPDVSNILKDIDEELFNGSSCLSRKHISILKEHFRACENLKSIVNMCHIKRTAKSFEYNVECLSRMTSKAFSINVITASVHAAITEVSKKSKDFNEGHYSVINCAIIRSIEV